MKCDEFNSLVHAYLDDELGGSLRLEFDTHRLRCPECRQQLAVLEALGNTLASDSEIPALADDFTSRVMDAIEQRQPLSRKLFSTRVAIVGGMLLQAAAVLFLAVMLQPTLQPGPSRGSDLFAANEIVIAAPEGGAAGGGMSVAGNPPLVATTDAAQRELDEIDLRELVISRFEQRIRRMHAAGRSLSGNLTQISQYLNIVLPEDLANADSYATVDPWSALWGSVFPLDPPAPQPAAVAASDGFTL